MGGFDGDGKQNMLNLIGKDWYAYHTEILYQTI